MITEQVRLPCIIRENYRIENSQFSEFTLFLKLLSPVLMRGLLNLRQEHLSSIKSLAMLHNLFPLVYSGVRRNRHLLYPEKHVHEFSENSRMLYLKGVAISAKQEVAENEIISLLDGKEMQSLVLKGNAIAREIYDDPNCRVSSDIDILIRKSDAEAVDAVLIDAGYLPEDDMPLGYCMSRIHHAQYRHHRNNILIEIHWLFGIPYFFNLSSEEIWDEISQSGRGEGRLSPEMILIMLLIHHHSHSFRELRILVDILWALIKFDGLIDWTLFVSKLERIGLIKSTRIALNQIQSLWHESICETKCVDTLIEELENTGQKTPKYLLSYFQMSPDNISSNLYRDKLVARFALDRLSITLLSYMKTLFPVPIAIKALYRDSRDWMLPLNYAKFIKWRVKEWVR